MAFLKLKMAGRWNDSVTVNTEDISSFYEDRGASYTDYYVVMRNGNRFRINYESYKILDDLS